MVSRGCLLAAVLVLGTPLAAPAATRGRASASAPPVSAFPTPNERFAPPRTQIAFRGMPVAQLGAISVTGSTSGVHSGVLQGDSDGQGGSFLPAKPFAAGETVTVRTALSIVGGSGGSFKFAVATPTGFPPYRPLPPAPRTRGDVSSFRSRPDLSPAAVRVLKRSSRTAPGDIFISPQQGPLQPGPMIVDPDGQLVWFKRIPSRQLTSDVRVQTYQGKPVLTWWQGTLAAGIGTGRNLINDTTYRVIKTVSAANGLGADLHEFEITPQGTALVTAYFPVLLDARSVHGAKRQVVLDSVAQEIDIATGLVLFEWNSLDHVSLSDSYLQTPKGANVPLDYFHINSVELDRDGNFVISGRNTWAGYKVDHSTGNVIWRLGGKHSSFKLGSGASFAFQHDLRVRSGGDLFVTVFDDGAGPPSVHKESRGLKLFLDFKHKTAKVVAQYRHGPGLLANFEGNVQQLPGGDNFLGWGQQPYFTEFNSRSQTIFDARFVGGNSTYRAYRFPWTGTPHTAPAVAATTGRHATAYASWNGATNVAKWKVLGGSSPRALRLIRTVDRRGFETAIGIRSQRYVQAQALDRAGHVLGTSPTVKAR